MTLPSKRWWRVFFWIAVIAILIEVLALTSTFVEARRRRVGDAPGLVPDQIAAVVHLWPGLKEPQRRDMLVALSSAGLNYHVTAEAPTTSSDTAHVREIEDAMRKRISPLEADSVTALIRAKPFGRDARAINWALSSEPVRIYVHLSGAIGWSPR
jgi:hypothetical protein